MTKVTMELNIERVFAAVRLLVNHTSQTLREKIMPDKKDKTKHKLLL